MDRKLEGREEFMQEMRQAPLAPDKHVRVVSMFCLALGMISILPYAVMALLSLQGMRTSEGFPRYPFLLGTLQPFCILFNGIIGGLLSIVAGTSALSLNQKRNRSTIFLAWVGMVLGTLGIVCNFLIIWFLSSGALG